MDLRKEFEVLLSTGEGVGRWFLIRHFDKTKKSEYWNEITKEAVGGPAYIYSDCLVEGYSAPMRRGLTGNSGLSDEKIGILEDKVEVFYLKHTVVIDESDELYDLNYYGKEKPTIVFDKTEENLSELKIVPKERYKVKKIETFKVSEGGIDYQSAYCEKTIFK